MPLDQPTSRDWLLERCFSSRTQPPTRTPVTVNRPILTNRKAVSPDSHHLHDSPRRLSPGYTYEKPTTTCDYGFATAISRAGTTCHPCVRIGCHTSPASVHAGTAPKLLRAKIMAGKQPGSGGCSTYAAPSRDHSPATIAHVRTAGCTGRGCSRTDGAVTIVQALRSANRAVSTLAFSRCPPRTER